MLKNRLIYDLKRLLSTDNDVQEYSEIDNRLLDHWLDTQRALWLKNEYNKNRSIESNVHQVLPSVEMQITSSSDTSGISSQGRFLKSTIRIPRPLELHHNYLLKVRSHELGSEYYNVIRFDENAYRGAGRFNSKMIYPFLFDEYLYVPIKKENKKTALITHVTIEGVFEVPGDIELLKGNDPMYSEYPIPLSFWEYIKGEIMKSNGRIFLQVKQEGYSEKS